MMPIHWRKSTSLKELQTLQKYVCFHSKKRTAVRLDWPLTVKGFTNAWKWKMMRVLLIRQNKWQKLLVKNWVKVLRFLDCFSQWLLSEKSFNSSTTMRLTWGKNKTEVKEKAKLISINNHFTKFFVGYWPFFPSL